MSISCLSSAGDFSVLLYFLLEIKQEVKLKNAQVVQANKGPSFSIHRAKFFP